MQVCMRLWRKSVVQLDEERQKDTEKQTDSIPSWHKQGIQTISKTDGEKDESVSACAGANRTSCHRNQSEKCVLIRVCVCALTC